MLYFPFNGSNNIHDLQHLDVLELLVKKRLTEGKDLDFLLKEIPRGMGYIYDMTNKTNGSFLMEKYMSCMSIDLKHLPHYELLKCLQIFTKTSLIEINLSFS